MAEAAVAAAVKIGTAVAAKLTAAKVVAAVAKVAVMYGINKVVANQNKPRAQGGMINLTINPDEPRRLQIGKRLNAGVLVDWYVRGSKNQNLYMIVYLGEGPMGQVTKVYGGGRVVYSTPLVHGTRTVIPNYRSGGDRLWITYYDGRPGQTADANLVSQSLGWTSNHVGTGCAYAIIEAQWDSDNMTSPPQIGFEIEGAKFYDRRKDTTAGGSGSHRIDSPSTWELSDNPAVALDHYLLGRYLGSVKTFGIGVDADDLPYDRFAALANLCDENVTLKAGGTQKRYRTNGFLFADRTYGDTIKDLCRHMNARPADFGGRLGVIDGEERTPVLTLTDGDVFGGVEQYSPKRSWADLVSEVRGTYQSPAQNYQAMEYPRVTDAAWVTADGGSPREATVDFEMETDPERAQRLAWLFAMRERRQAQLTGTYALRAIELEQGDWFVRSGGIFGEGKTFEVIDRALNIETMTVTLTAFEVDPADTAWDEDIAADAPPDPVSSTDTLQVMEVPGLTVTGVTLSGAVAQLPAIKVEWTAPDDPRVRQIVIEAVPQAGGTPTAQVVDAATGEAVFTSGITDDTDYYVRARFIGTFIPSEWTSTISVTTTGDYAVGEATSVPWSGVTGAGKPDDNADVTGDNTAAAIDGQGWGATAAESAASNDYAPFGGNRLYDTRFNRINDYWSASATAGTLVGYLAGTTEGARFLRHERSGLSAGAVMFLGNTPQASAQICKPGDVVFAGAYVSATNCSSAQCYAVFLDASLNVIASGGTVGGTAITSGLNYTPSNRTLRATVKATAPTGTRYVRFVWTFTAASAGSMITRIIEPQSCFLPSINSADPPYEEGRDYEEGADPTIYNTASAILGQGSQATANAGRGNTASRPTSTGSYSWYANTEAGWLQLDIPSDGWTNISPLTTGSTPDDKAVSKTGRGANTTTSGTTWIVAATLDMTAGTSGNFRSPTAQLVADPTMSLSAGSSFSGEWRVCEATQAAPGTKTVKYSGTFLATDTGGGLFDFSMDGEDTSQLKAATNSGACRYTLEIRRASGTNNITGGGVDSFFAVEWIPSG